MQIQKVAVHDLFSGADHYVVPSFQRRYVWGEDRQWSPLWQDVADKAAEVLERGKGVRIVPHFFGALVLKEQPTGLGQPTRRLVVDGQQRLTTLQIMIIAIADALHDILSKTGAERIQSTRDYLRTLVKNQLGKNDSRYKIRPFADRDFGVLRELVDGKEAVADGKEAVADHVLQKCRVYFRTEVDAWLQADPSGVAERAEVLAEVLSRKFEVVGLNLDADEDEYVIFEALNSRGTPLTEWEKSKNHLLSKSRQTSLGEEKFYEKYVACFDISEWWSEVVKLTRFQGSRSELFLNYWLTIKLCRGITADRAYYDFCNVVKNEQSLIDMTEVFVDYADVFRHLDQKEKDHTILGLFRYRLDVLRITVVMPLMMELYRIFRANDQFGRFDQCCSMVESYLVRRQIMQWSTRGYRDLFINLLRGVVNRNEADDTRQVLFDGLMSAPWDWPTDDEILSAVLSHRASPGVASSRLRMVLEAVEDHLISIEAGTMAGHQRAPRYLWIEHIMPQKWQTHWPLSEGASEEDYRKRDHALTTLGNLTLTTSELDISLAHSRWDKKRGSLRRYDNLFLNRDLLKQYRDCWDEATIEERGQSLAEVICNVWPNAENLRARFGLEEKTEEQD